MGHQGGQLRCQPVRPRNLAVGYQDSDQVAGGGYLIIKNSWTSDWGDGGLAYVTYEWLQHSLLDAQALVRIDSVK